MTEWRNRIVGHGEEAPDQLLANPLNWRTHPIVQQEALKEILQNIGWVQDIIVNRRTGHLIDGHLRVQLALRDHDVMVPVTYVDLSEEEERTILATFDPIGDLATADKAKLSELLQTVDIGDAIVRKLLDQLKVKHGITEPKPVQFHARTSLIECPNCGHKWER